MAIYSLFDLREPVLALIGRLLPVELHAAEHRAAEHGAEVLVGDGEARIFAEDARPVLEYFATPRLWSEAEVALAKMGVEEVDLGFLVDRGILWQFGPGDSADTIRRLSPLLVRITAPLAPQQNRPGRVCLTVDDSRVCVITGASSEVFRLAGEQPLGQSVPAVAARLDLDDVALWRLVAADLVAVLRTGTGFVVPAVAR